MANKKACPDLDAASLLTAEWEAKLQAAMQPTPTKPPTATIASAFAKPGQINWFGEE